MPLGLAHDGASRHDSKLLAETLDSIPIERPKPSRRRPQGLCLDRGYDYAALRETVAERGFTPHIRRRGEEIQLKQDKTATGRSSSAGRRKPTTTSPCSSTPAA